MCFFNPIPAGNLVHLIMMWLPKFGISVPSRKFSPKFVAGKNWTPVSLILGEVQKVTPLHQPNFGIRTQLLDSSRCSGSTKGVLPIILAVRYHVNHVPWLKMTGKKGW